MEGKRLGIELINSKYFLIFINICDKQFALREEGPQMPRDPPTSTWEIKHRIELTSTGQQHGFGDDFHRRDANPKIFLERAIRFMSHIVVFRNAAINILR